MQIFQNDLTVRDYHPHVSAYYYRQWDNFNMPFHTHDDVEIMYVISGTCQVNIAEQWLSLKKGDFILLNANVPHRLVVQEGEPCRMLNVEFSFREHKGSFPSLRQLAQENGDLLDLFETSQSFVLLSDPVDVYQTLRSLVLEMDEQGREDSLLVHLLLTQILIRIARLFRASKNSTPYHTDLYIKRALEYMHHQYDCDIQVKDIAAAVNLHPGYLHRIFKEHTGQTLMQYLTSFRMEKAKMLLLHTDIPIIQIPEYIGVSSGQYFSALFKKHTGQTPRQYRDTADKKYWEKR